MSTSPTEPTPFETRRPEEPTPDERPAPDYAELLEQIAGEARGMGRDVGDLLRVGADRVRIEARERGFRLVAGLWMGLVLAAVTVLAVYFLVDGLAGLLTGALDGQVWAGRLATGVLLLGLVGLGMWIRQIRVRRASLRRLESKYAATDREETR